MSLAMRMAKEDMTANINAMKELQLNGRLVARLTYSPKMRGSFDPHDASMESGSKGSFTFYGREQGVIVGREAGFESPPTSWKKLTITKESTETEEAVENPKLSLHMEEDSDHAWDLTLSDLPPTVRKDRQSLYEENHRKETSRTKAVAISNTATVEKQPSERAISTKRSKCCSTCSRRVYLLKTRCLVCSKLYCRFCVKEAMGYMLEGRKCRTCLGRPFSKTYVDRVGQGFSLPKVAREAEIKWLMEILNVSSTKTSQSTTDLSHQIQTEKSSPLVHVMNQKSCTSQTIGACLPQAKKSKRGAARKLGSTLPAKQRRRSTLRVLLFQEIKSST